MNYPQKSISWFLEVIFPIRCIGCGKFDDYICRKCLNSISINKNFGCIGCKRNTPFGQTCYLCVKTNLVDQLLIVADYNNHLVEKSLKFLKYRFISDLDEPLLVLVKKYLKWLTLDKKFNVFNTNPLLIPVPLHQRRFNWRGFNQSELLAKGITDTFQMEINSGIIERSINTTPQADIKEKDKRLINLEGIFKITNKEKISGREVLLIDDVCTTGTTLNECAKVLKANGASKVIALVVARG